MGVERDLARKLGNLTWAGLGGMFSPHSQAHAELFNEEYRSSRCYPNPFEREMLKGLLVVWGLKSGEVVTKGRLCSVPWERRVFSKSQFLGMMVAFSDQHRAQVAESWFRPEAAGRFVEKVIVEAKREKRQLTVVEQFGIAMELTGGWPLAAFLVAHAGSRAVGRGRDTRVGEQLNFTWEQMCEWRDCVSYFGDEDNYGDPPGDTYHFWGGVVGGLTASVEVNGRDRWLNPIYKRIIYPNVAVFTRSLRGWELGRLHGWVDKLGVRVGERMAKLALDPEARRELFEV